MNTRRAFKADVPLHNEFLIEVVDSRTGRLRQTAHAYNVITNYGWGQIFKLLTEYQSNNYAIDYYFAMYIMFGSGSTTPAATDTNLTSAIGNKAASTYEYNIDYNTMQGYRTRWARLEAGEYTGAALREVGLADSNIAGRLTTHALIVDGAGNPITINKGEFDVVNIYAKFYASLSHAYGDHFMFVKGAYHNHILGRLVAATINRYQNFYWRTGGNSALPVLADEAVKTQLGEVQFTPVKDEANKKITYATRIPAGTGNGNVWEIGIHVVPSSSSSAGPIFRAVVPVANYTGSTIEDETVGTGDGAQTVFQTTHYPVREGSQTVYLDGVAATEDTDYTFDAVTGTITFTNPPGAGVAVTCTYTVDFIPKTIDNVIDLSFVLQFSQGV